MAFNLGNAFANLFSVPAGLARGIGRGVAGIGRGLGSLGSGIGSGIADAWDPATNAGRPFAGTTDMYPRAGSGPDPGGSVARVATYQRKGAAEGPNEFLQPAPSGTGWRANPGTRDLLGASTADARQVSLDFNDASNASARGVEIIIPDDASDAERTAAQAYVDRTQKFFASHGVEVPVRGVKTRAENGRGTTGRFHTEPFFIKDAASRDVMAKHSAEYARVLADTLGTIPGVTFISPHTSTDPGASGFGFNERDFARDQIMPHLLKLQPRPGQGPQGGGAANPFLMPRVQ